MTQIEKIQDKIKGEIDSARDSKILARTMLSKQYWHGELKALQKLQKWIKDNIEDIEEELKNKLDIACMKLGGGI